MLSDYYNDLKEVEREFDEINQDGMGKLNGHWFSKGMNKLRSLRIKMEQDMMTALGIHSVDLDD